MNGMDQFLDVLKQASVFLVASRMILHFFPGKKYDRYGKMMVALIVLSQLAIPILSLFKEDGMGAFLERVDRLETENEMFSQKLEALSEGQEGLIENGVVLSVEERLKEAAAEAGVEVRDVAVNDGTVVIEVEAGGEEGGIAIERVEQIEIGREKDAAYADAGARKGVRRTDLAAAFAGELGMREGQVEVIERR